MRTKAAARNDAGDEAGCDAASLLERRPERSAEVGRARAVRRNVAAAEACMMKGAGVLGGDSAVRTGWYFFFFFFG